jgi:uncharacterized membrane protein YeiH
VTPFLIVDLIAVATNSLFGALLARSPTHYKDYTDVGIVILAVISGLAGGTLRDILLNQVPVALTNPVYLLVAIAAGVLAVLVTHRAAEEFLDGALQFFIAFALPWYAVSGTEKGLASGLGFLSAVLLGVVDATLGRSLVDAASGVTAQALVRGEWYMGTAGLASVLYASLAEARVALVPATAITVAVSFALRFAALRFGWELPQPQEPIAPHRQHRGRR